MAYLVLSFRIDPNVALKIVKPDLQAIGLVQAVIVQSISAPLRRYVFKNLEFLVPAPRDRGIHGALRLRALIFK